MDDPKTESNPAPAPAETPAPVPSEPVPTAETPVTAAPVESAPIDDLDDELGLADETDQTDLPVEQAKSPLSAQEAAAANAQAHQHLKLIGIISIAVLVFAILVALAGWAYYSQSDNNPGSDSTTSNLYGE